MRIATRNQAFSAQHLAPTGQDQVILIVKMDEFKRLAAHQSIQNVHLICIDRRWYIASKYRRSTLGVGVNLQSLRPFDSLDAVYKHLHDCGITSFKIDTRFSDLKPDTVKSGTQEYSDWFHKMVMVILPDATRKNTAFDPSRLIAFSQQIKNEVHSHP